MNFDALIGDDNTKRLFAELTADRDRTDVRPVEAYQTILHSIHPGWKLRVLQLYWPDPEPRVTFFHFVEKWRQSSEGLAILKEGLELALDQTSLPFGKRTFIEFVQIRRRMHNLVGDSCRAVRKLRSVRLLSQPRRDHQTIPMDFQSGFGVNMPNVFHQFLDNLKGEDPALQSKESDDFRSVVASASFKIGRDYLQFPKVVVLPVTARGVGVPGMSDRPWSRLYADIFFAGNAPIMYSLSIYREPPDTMQSNLRARRTLTEGVILAMAEKTGRRPSMAEKITDSAMDAAESSLALGKPIYKISLMAALYAGLTRYDEVETIRRSIEAKMRTMGLIPQRLDAIPERALYYLQPGGTIFPDLDKPILFAEEIAALLPKPSRQIMPVDDSVWIGRHLREGRDVHFSFTRGVDPTAPPPPHAITLVLGEMGSGKTTLMRWIFLQRLLQGRTILSIDPEGENNKLCEAVGGHVIPAGVPEDKETCLIHPLVADTPEEMLLAVRFLVAALTEVSTLTPGVQAALHEAVKRRWERRPGEQMSIADLVEVLATISTPDALVPMSLLRPYMRGGLFEGFFDRPRALLST